MTQNPLNHIEDKKAWMDFGKQAYWIHRGAMEEGATDREAVMMVVAFYTGMFKGHHDEGEGEEV